MLGVAWGGSRWGLLRRRHFHRGEFEKRCSCKFCRSSTGPAFVLGTMFRALRALRWFGQLDEERNSHDLKHYSSAKDGSQNIEMLPQAVLISAISQFLGPVGICRLAECNSRWRGPHLFFYYLMFRPTYPIVAGTCLEDDELWASFCAERWRNTFLARDRPMPHGGLNPFYGCWSVCRLSQTRIDRTVEFLETPMPSGFCSFTQPG